VLFGKLFFAVAPEFIGKKNVSAASYIATFVNSTKGLQWTQATKRRYIGAENLGNRRCGNCSIITLMSSLTGLPRTRLGGRPMARSGDAPKVYSTDYGRICPACGKPSVACSCKEAKPVVKKDGIVRVGRETKGRKGKGVTTITGLPLDDAGILALAKELKKRCGSGGTVKDGIIEIQGDHRETVVADLQKYGWQVKRSGG
jgi:translation initiation factor 1